MIYHNPIGNETCVVHVVSVLANESVVRTRQNRVFSTLHKKIMCTSIFVKSACPFRIVCKAVVLLVRQLRHGFTKKAKVSPILTVAHVHTYMHACMHACMRACVHACIHTYIPDLSSLTDYP